MISKFTGVLTPLLTGPYPSYDLLTYEDDTAHDQWYVVLALPFVDKNLIKYTGVNGKISSQWLMDPVISYGDIEAIFTLKAPDRRRSSLCSEGQSVQVAWHRDFRQIRYLRHRGRR